MIDLPKLSNYADTDNLLSWPSPQHINLLEHFDSSYEMELSESFDDRHLNEDKDLRGKKFIRNRRKSFGYASLNTSNAETVNCQYRHNLTVSVNRSYDVGLNH
jgi:hypothetical protein